MTVDNPTRTRTTFLLTVLLLLLAIVWFFPILWLLSKAVTPNAAIIREFARLVPATLSMENFQRVLMEFTFLRWIYNSVLVAIGVLLVTLTTATMAAYSFSRLRWPGRNVLFMAILASMFVPWEINAIPLYFVVRNIDLLNTRPGIFLPISAMPIGVFLLRQFMIDIPQDLEDAAQIDGASRFGTLTRIFVPMIRPALGAVAIWYFIFTWNEFFWSLISIQGSRIVTLPIGLKRITGVMNIQYGVLFGASALALVPSLLVFVGLRRTIIRGVSLAGSIK